MTDLSALIACVEEGTGPDRELDRAIMSVFYVEGERFIGARYVDNDEPVFDRVWVDPATDKWVTTHPYEFTASLDRVISLIEQKLPEFSFVSAPDFLAGAIDEMMERGWFPGKPSTPQICRAVLLSFLRALEDSNADLADATNKIPPPPLERSET